MRLRLSSSFILKALAAAALVGLADRLFWVPRGIGSTLGIFALAWTAAALALTPAAWGDRRSWIASMAALLLAVPLVDAPGPLAALLFWTCLTMAVLLPRTSGLDHAGRWALRLILHGVTSMVGPWQDLLRLRRPLGRTLPKQRILPLLPLPVLGGAVFLALFASANPVIGDALYRIGAPRFEDDAIARLLLWGMVATTVWATLRPRHVRLPGVARSAGAPLSLPGVSPGSVLLALLTFNLLFALQNALDLAFLWSGAALPDGMTLADYAHRGAYPLIITALLAGLFVLVALRPGTATAQVPAIRRLVVLWIAQNVFLVGSTILRTIDYIEVYSLTRLRIAALIWMALVAVGLVLIVWRMLGGKSAAWLINANVVTGLLVLGGCTMVDLGSVAASWNVRHAREVGGKGAALDLCYLNELGSSALTSLVALELRPDLSADLRERLASVRHRVLIRTIDGQLGGEWTWRNGRRLREIGNMLAGRKLRAEPPGGPAGRDCDGALNPPPASPEQASQAPAASTEGPAEQPMSSPALTNEAGR